MNSVAWCVECKPLLYHLSGGGECLWEFFLRVRLGTLVINVEIYTGM
jgi:hypothetical protein